MRAIISGGGTAGHINPALATAGRLAKEHQADILFIGTKKGLESTLVPKAGWDIRYIEVSGLVRRLTLQNVLVIKQFITAISHCKKIIKEFRPDVVIGTGGYVCAPVLFAAHALGIPTLVHEQNVIPGVTVKMTAKTADSVCISFPETTSYLKPACAKKCVLTGNPIREEMLTISKEAARKKLNLDNRPFIVSFGGSLGAERLNQAAIDFLNKEKTGKLQFLLGTGQRYYDTVKSAVTNYDPAISVVPYIENMDTVMAAADLVIGRAGALTVSELCALGKPSILVPSPNVAHDHQTYNAKSVETAGGAVLIPDAEFSGETLSLAITELLNHPRRLTEMSENAKNIGIVDGAKRICDVACRLSNILQ
ncbi:MAG: undecaprenyldiphospho-muramoylpentapeptide beta-N-acetylglucosaminyltransferase [Clostridia bacterium]|nr:undecaprenyldiphospho-muramoylpentapeptide beta-N-acetylglucosaminyltransferase [Clostridia bacterium]